LIGWFSVETRFYQMFDCLIACDFPLPGLSESSRAPTDISIEVIDDKAEFAGFTWFHEWKVPDGQPVILGGKKGETYLLRFPGVADYLIHPAIGLVSAFRRPGTSIETLAHLLTGQVIPRLICHRGRIVLHASAVQLKNGRSIAFLGESGKGKSTLVSSYLQTGGKLLTDDCLLLQRSGQVLVCIPAFPSLRLWPDSLEAVFPGSAEFITMAYYGNKSKHVGLNKKCVETAPVALSALYILGGGDDEAPEDDSIRIEPMGGAGAMKAMIQSAFLLDAVSAESLKQNFAAMTEVLNSDVPCFSLNYARRYELLPKVREAVDIAMNWGGKD
jgi:hypothetical protein